MIIPENFGYVYALKSKDQVLEKFKEFHASVERQLSKQLKCIRTDNGSCVFLPSSSLMTVLYFINPLSIVTKDQNIGKHGYIGNWILRKYRKYR